MNGSGNQPIISADELIERIHKYHPNCDGETLRRAYDFSKQAHEGKFRFSGDPYFTHPVAVAVILTDLMLDETTVAAGLLHDCIEDVEGVTFEVIQEQFSTEIAQLVDGVTKLRKLDFTSREEEQAASLRKMMLAMAKDIRVVLIKLADRLHNMRTLKTQKKERQVPIARETLDIYAPLAHRLGVYTIKWELEDLALRYLDPEAYEDLVKKVGMTRADREKLISSVTQTLTAQLRLNGIKCEIEGRPKHFYSIYRKMKTQNKTFDQIHDLIAIRVLVETVQDCYFVLGVVHTLWPQMPGRFKDYISVPKANKYQSLHTTVVNMGRPFEVQIRTFEMHRIAEYGIAAHWRYKEGGQDDELDERLAWLRDIIDWEKETNDPNDFNEVIKHDLFADEVIVFTPRGDVISLPRGATPIDFAYRIHSAVGNRCTGAKVNGRMVNLAYELQTGEFVEVVTSQSSKGPSPDWLNIAKTSEAKSKIRASLKKQSRDVNIVRGKEMLEKEAAHMGYSLSQLTKKEYVEVLLKRYSFQTMDDVYSSVGFGGTSGPQIVNRLIEEYKKEHKPQIDEILTVDSETPRKKPQSTSNGVTVKGESGMLVRFARCCTPLPGDDIVGYITHGQGVTVHKADCTNMTSASLDRDRLIEVEWENESLSNYDADIRIFCVNRTGLLGDLGAYFAGNDVPVQSVSARRDRGNYGMSIIDMTITVKNKGQLDMMIRELNAKRDIDEVKRV